MKECKICRTQEEFNHVLFNEVNKNKTIIFDEGGVLPKDLGKSSCALLLKKYFENKRKLQEEELRNFTFSKNKLREKK